MDFVEEEDGSAAVVFEAAACLGDDLADAGDADLCGVLGDEGGVDVMGDDAGERGFARARWAVEEEGGESACAEHAGEEGLGGCVVGGEDVGLADEFGEGSWAHADGERLDRIECFASSIGEEIWHGAG